MAAGEVVPKRNALLAAAIVALALDQATKRWAESALALGERHALVEGLFYLTHTRNPGAAFGLLAEVDSSLRIAILSCVLALAAFVVLSIYRGLGPGERSSAAMLGLVLGGGTGNLIDRLRPGGEGAVLDFLHLRPAAGYALPDFNLADAFVVIGVVGLGLFLAASEGAARASVPARSDPSDDAFADAASSEPGSGGESAPDAEGIRSDRPRP